MGSKFDELSRHLVIRNLEKTLGVHLIRIKGYRKIFRDATSGNCYCILGGIDNWHGIPKSFFDEDHPNWNASFIVIAKQYRTTIEVYMSLLSNVIASKKLLSTSSTQYQFFVKRFGSQSLAIRELPHFFPRKIMSIPYSDDSSEREKTLIELEKHLANMSEGELSDFVSEVQKRRDTN